MWTVHNCQWIRNPVPHREGISRGCEMQSTPFMGIRVTFVGLSLLRNMISISSVSFF